MLMSTFRSVLYNPSFVLMEIPVVILLLELLCFLFDTGHFSQKHVYSLPTVKVLHKSHNYQWD